MLYFSAFSTGFSRLVDWSCQINDGAYNFNQLTQYFNVDSNDMTDFVCGSIQQMEDFGLPKGTIDLAAIVLTGGAASLLLYKAYKQYRGEPAALQSLVSSVLGNKLTPYVMENIGDKVEATVEAQLKALPNYAKLSEAAIPVIKDLIRDNVVKASKIDLKAHLKDKAKEIADAAKKKQQEMQQAKELQKKFPGVEPAKKPEPKWVEGVEGILRPLSGEKAPAEAPVPASPASAAKLQ